MMNKRIWFFTLIIICVNGIECMTKQQLKNSLKAAKKSCMTKNQVNEDEVGKIDQGKFVEERKVMCYIACVYKTSQIIKNNKLNYEASMKQIDVMYPPEIRAASKVAVDACVDYATIDDICKASFYTAKCMYEYDPNVFIFA